jgi:hypothetical protein
LERVEGVNYLYMRSNGTFVVRVQVPADLRSSVGQTEFKKSVGKDAALAKRNCHAVIAELQARIDDAQKRRNKNAQTNAGTVTREQIDLAVYSHFQRMLKRLQDRTGYNRKEYIEHLQAIVESQIEATSLEHWSMFSVDAEWLLEEHGWQLSCKSEAFDYLCEAMARARIQAYRNEIRRLQGIRRDDPQADPLFSESRHQTTPAQTLGGLLDTFVAEREIKWSPSTKVNYRIIIKVLEEICGRDTPAAEIDKKFCMSVRDALLRMPSNYQKKPETRGKPIVEVLKIAEQLALPKMMPATINSHLGLVTV